MPSLLIICSITDVMRQRLSDAFDLHETAQIEDMAGWLTSHGPEIEFVLTDGHLGVPQPILDALPNLQIISSYGVGYDAIDVDAATRRGIPVCHTPGVLTDEVATTAVMLYLALWRNLEAQSSLARSGRWGNGHALPLSRTADGRVVGILGLGRIGQAIAKKLEAFGATILYHGRTKKDVPYRFHSDLSEMARACDTLICAAPGDASTRHLIDAKVIEALGPEGYLINVGRGSTVDEDALITALADGTLGGAGLDVFENEPHIPEALRALSNVILTPHIGSATVETRRAMGDLAIDNLLAQRDGAALLTPVPESKAALGL